MRILCPEHNSPIELPDHILKKLDQNPFKALVYRCPECKQKIGIHPLNLLDTNKGAKKTSKFLVLLEYAEMREVRKYIMRN